MELLTGANLFSCHSHASLAAAMNNKLGPLPASFRYLTRRRLFAIPRVVALSICCGAVIRLGKHAKCLENMVTWREEIQGVGRIASEETSRSSAKTHLKRKLIELLRSWEGGAENIFENEKDKSEWHRMSSDPHLIDFLAGLLTYLPRHRLTPAQALCHPFLTELCPAALLMRTDQGGKPPCGGLPRGGLAAANSLRSGETKAGSEVPWLAGGLQHLRQGSRGATARLQQAADGGMEGPGTQAEADGYARTRGDSDGSLLARTATAGARPLVVARMAPARADEGSQDESMSLLGGAGAQSGKGTKLKGGFVDAQHAELRRDAHAKRDAHARSLSHLESNHVESGTEHGLAPACRFGTVPSSDALWAREKTREETPSTPEDGLHDDAAIGPRYRGACELAEECAVGGSGQTRRRAGAGSDAPGARLGKRRYPEAQDGRDDEWLDRRPAGAQGRVAASTLFWTERLGCSEAARSGPCARRVDGKRGAATAEDASCTSAGSEPRAADGRPAVSPSLAVSCSSAGQAARVSPGRRQAASGRERDQAARRKLSRTRSPVGRRACRAQRGAPALAPWNPADEAGLAVSSHANRGDVSSLPSDYLRRAATRHFASQQTPAPAPQGVRVPAIRRLAGWGRCEPPLAGAAPPGRLETPPPLVGALGPRLWSRAAALGAAALGAAALGAGRTTRAADAPNTAALGAAQGRSGRAGLARRQGRESGAGAGAWGWMQSAAAEPARKPAADQAGEPAASRLYGKAEGDGGWMAVTRACWTDGGACWTDGALDATDERRVSGETSEEMGAGDEPARHARREHARRTRREHARRESRRGDSSVGREARVGESGTDGGRGGGARGRRGGEEERGSGSSSGGGGRGGKPEALAGMSGAVLSCWKCEVLSCVSLFPRFGHVDGVAVAPPRCGPAGLCHGCQARPSLRPPLTDANSTAFAPTRGRALRVLRACWRRCGCGSGCCGRA